MLNYRDDLPLIRAMARGNPITAWLWSLRIRRDALRAKNLRLKTADDLGAPVPEALVFSLTTKCPEACSFCVSADYENSATLKKEAVLKVVREAKELGIFTVILAGGEPLLVPELLFPVIESNKDMLFLLFTGGSGLTQEIALRTRARNLFTFVGVDEERQKWELAIRKLHQAGSSYGFSAVVSESTAARFSSHEFINLMRERGCTAGVFFERLPVGRAAEFDFGLNEASRNAFRDSIRLLGQKTGLLLRFFPEDEDESGGCVAAGRGILHINAAGRVEPCPFIHVAGENVMEHSLTDILRSPFLSLVRSVAEHKPSGHPCALLKNSSLSLEGKCQ